MARRPRVAFEESVAMSTLSPIRMDSWRQQAMLTRGRSLPDIGNASTLHPNLRKLVEMVERNSGNGRIGGGDAGGREAKNKQGAAQRRAGQRRRRRRRSQKEAPESARGEL